MRVLQIVALITPDGAYGGPVRVAVNQSLALAEAGHQVQLIAGARGFGGDLPTRFMDCPVTLFAARTIVPGTGFAGLTSAALLRWLTANVREFDVVHVHLARDLITLPAAAIARAAGIPYVVQTHGMIDAPVRALAGPLDRILTRPILRRAESVLYLTEREADGLTLLTDDDGLPLRYLPNGVPLTELRTVRRPVLEVLFLARLHPRKRPLQFVAMAVRLHAAFPDVRFCLVGPDEGEGPDVQRAIEEAGLKDTIRWEGALDPARTLERMSTSAVYVLPSVDEPFGMSVVEAMSLGLPVVIGQSCGLAAQVSRSGCGTVFDGSLEGLVEAVAEYLSHPEKRIDDGVRARRTAEEEFGMSGVVRELQKLYEESRVAGRGRSPNPLMSLGRPRQRGGH